MRGEDGISLVVIGGIYTRRRTDPHIKVPQIPPGIDIAVIRGYEFQEPMSSISQNTDLVTRLLASIICLIPVSVK